jgi:hypothetical protein
MFCGCVSLVTGVEAVAFVTLLYCVCTISLCSSKESLAIFGVVIHPFFQVIAGTWALFGIPLAINAGVGVLYRIETSLRMFLYYQSVSLLAGLLFPSALILSGSLCATVADKAVQRMGTSFACGVVDVFTFFWLALVGIIHAYLIYVIWSAAEEIRVCPFPELEKYRQHLKENRFMPAKGPQAQTGFREDVAQMQVRAYGAAPVIGALPPQMMVSQPVPTMMVSQPVPKMMVNSNYANYGMPSQVIQATSPRQMAPSYVLPGSMMASEPVMGASMAGYGAGYGAPASLSYTPTPPMSQNLNAPGPAVRRVTPPMSQNQNAPPTPRRPHETVVMTPAEATSNQAVRLASAGNLQVDTRSNTPRFDYDQQGDYGGVTSVSA